MKKVILKIFAIAFLFSLLFARPVSAHEDDPRIEISAERLNPGSVLELRGVGFAAEEQVTLAIAGSGAELSLADVITDAEGVFVLTVTLPADLAEGAYVVRATTGDHVVNSPQITIAGAAFLEGGEEGAWEEGDTLLGPMPTYAPAAATQVPEVQIPGQAEVPPGRSMFLVWIAVGVSLILLGVLARRFVRSS